MHARAPCKALRAAAPPQQRVRALLPPPPLHGPADLYAELLHEAQLLSPRRSRWLVLIPFAKPLFEAGGHLIDREPQGLTDAGDIGLDRLAVVVIVSPADNVEERPLFLHLLIQRFALLGVPRRVR